MKTIFTLLCIGFISFTTLAQSKVITVDNRPNSGADYTNLATAITNTIVGDTIYVHPSATVYSAITISKPLVIVAMGHNPANSSDGERAYVGGITFTGNCANTLITGLYIGYINTSGTITNGRNIKIANNRIANYITGNNNVAYEDWVIEGNIFDSAYVNPNGANGWIIKNNIFNNSSWAMYHFNNTDSFINNIVINSSVNFAYNCTNPIVNNNIFILGTVTEVGSTNSTITFNNNLTYNFDGFSVTSLSGSNNLDNTNPQFVDAPSATFNAFYNNNYDLAGTSAAKNAGTDGTDIGVFGANFNFDVNGRPDLWPYMTSLTITNASVASGQNINVEFTAQKKN